MITFTRGMGWIVFWVATIVLGLLIVPVMRNTGAIPMMVFAVIVLAIGSALLGKGTGRQMVVSGATLVLVLSILSFFLPLTARRIPEKVESFDAWLASRPTPTPAKTTAVYHPPAPTPVRQVVQLPDCPTPCTIRIRQVHDLYTDGEAVDILPPGWSEGKKIHYSGHGHLVLEGGNTHEGEWKFWSSDPSKVVMIRAFERR